MSFDPSLSSWVKVPNDSDFTIHNIPFGIGDLPSGTTRACTRIGDQVVDLVAMFDAGLLPVDGLTRAVLDMDHLNEFISLGKETTNKVRQALIEALSDYEGTGVRETVEKCMFHISKVTMRLPIDIGDYTDFYSSREHATNVGTMFRDPDNALLPNWLHLPVGYHGRASSIVVSGTPIHRPSGQFRPQPGAAQPGFGPSQRLDFELEMGFVVGKDTTMGQQVSTDDADEYIFGMVLFNDWSARDIQAWEYVPLGPFLGKSFASTMSPWIVTLEALKPFRVSGPVQEPEVLPYLKYDGDRSYDIDLHVAIQPLNGQETIVCTSNHKYLYWNIAQQLAHHTVNGCNIRVGDLYASGTISGKDESAYGSMLELAWKGTKPITLADGTTRSFIHDGDTVVLRGHCERDGVRVGFGEASAQVSHNQD